MANKRDLKKDINYVMGDIIEAVYIWELTNPSKETKESQSIIDDAIVGFDELIVKVNQRDLENAKAHFKAVNQELEAKGSAFILGNSLVMGQGSWQWSIDVDYVMGNFDSAELNGVDVADVDADYNSFRIGVGLRYNF